MLVYRRLGRDVPWDAGRDHWWHEALDGAARTFETERTDPEDPYMLIYTSGTTGRPKGAVHVHGGFPIKATQDMAHCFDVGEQDIIFWFTDMGWMMGPWLFSGALMLGATALCYEGSPDYPAAGPRLGAGRAARRHRPGHRADGDPGADAARRRSGSRSTTSRALRVLGGTGEPWNPEPWRWYFQHVGGGRCPIINYSGGTEIAGGIVGCHTIHPLKPCSFAGPIPGMAADVVDDEGQPGARRGRRAGDPQAVARDDARLLARPGPLRGDVLVAASRTSGSTATGRTIDDDGFWFIQGRSDDTIKIAGKRRRPGRGRVGGGRPPGRRRGGGDRRARTRSRARAWSCSRSCRPNQEPAGRPARRRSRTRSPPSSAGRCARRRSASCSDLPKTRNAKIMRRVIRAKHLGATDLGDLSGLENPAAIEEIARAR